MILEGNVDGFAVYDNISATGLQIGGLRRNDDSGRRPEGHRIGGGDRIWHR